ncbi:MAG: hypothetical protein LBI15_05680 [Dysgonamonadaceae bacterium]|nr:hypothetical protein [Dysgonamonadaceae bacterium]
MVRSAMPARSATTGVVPRMVRRLRGACTSIAASRAWSAPVALLDLVCGV